MQEADVVALLQAAIPADYEVVRPLKAGGQGSVLLANFQGAKVALKVLRPDSEPKRILREIELLRTIQCDHIVSILDSLEVRLLGNSYQLLVYEFHDGGDLRNWLASADAGTDGTFVLRVGCQVSIAIEELWRRRVVHRDIKPDNIVQAKDGRLVLVDFGIARHLDLSTVTVGGVPGTLGYMSPEQAAGRRNLTVRSDIFSLGVTLYELASGTHPFNGTQARIGSPPAVSLDPRQTGLPVAACSLIQRTLCLSPSYRPASVASGFANILEGYECSA